MEGGDGVGGSSEKKVEKELIGLGWGRGDGQKNDLNSLFKRVIWSTHGVGAKLPRQKKKRPNWGGEAVTKQSLFKPRNLHC